MAARQGPSLLKGICIYTLDVGNLTRYFAISIPRFWAWPPITSGVLLPPRIYKLFLKCGADGMQMWNSLGGRDGYFSAVHVVEGSTGENVVDCK
jgi:hypothetical protein